MDSFSKSSYGGLLCQGRLCVPTVEELRNEILTETHNTSFSMHLGDTKTYHELKQHYW